MTVDASADPEGLALALRSTAPDGICTSTAIALAASGALHPELVTTSVVGWSDAADALLEKGWTKLVIER